MSDQAPVAGEISGEIAMVDAVRLPRSRRDDDTTLIRPRAWPRATRDLSRELPKPDDVERLRTTIWFALGGLLTALGLYLVF